MAVSDTSAYFSDGDDCAREIDHDLPINFEEMAQTVFELDEEWQEIRGLASDTASSSSLSSYSPRDVARHFRPDIQWDAQFDGRPFWEPPILEYSQYERLIDAQKEANEERPRDVEWRVDAMNLEMEDNLLRAYQDAILELQSCPSGSGRIEAVVFYEQLHRDLEVERDAVIEEEEHFTRDQGLDKEAGYQLFCDLRERADKKLK